LNPWPSSLKCSFSKRQERLKPLLLII
jgi:hypothetical protein